jgi:hypothetical protein
MDDPRLRQLLADGFTCATCGERHSGLFDIAFDYPDPWSGPHEKEPNGAVQMALDDGRDILSEDFCLMGEDRFVRAVLPLPLIGTNESLAFGVWGTLSQVKFLEYTEHFDDVHGSQMLPSLSWLSNRLPRAGHTPVRTQLLAQNGRQRPILKITEPDHPFYETQSDGLSYEALLEIYVTYGHKPLAH